MKSKRQEKILELIEKYNIETQEELIARLAECGIESKQTTVSRDIKELYLYKEPIGGGRSRYAVSGKADHIDNTKRLKLILNECSVGVDYAGIVVLLKTLPGLADTIVKEYPFAYTGAEGEIPYYAILEPKNQELYEKYHALAGGLPHFYLLGRLAEYKYYNIDAMTKKAMELADAIMAENTKR